MGSKVFRVSIDFILSKKSRGSCTEKTVYVLTASGEKESDIIPGQKE